MAEPTRTPPTSPTPPTPPADEAPPASRGLVMAIFGEFESVGLALGPLIAGFTAGRLGLGPAFGVTAAVALAALAALPLSAGGRTGRRNSAAGSGEGAGRRRRKT